jgi:hypothetical protein
MTPHTKRRLTEIPIEVCNLITIQYTYAPIQPACDYANKKDSHGRTQRSTQRAMMGRNPLRRHKLDGAESHNSLASTSEKQNKRKVIYRLG